MFRPPRRNRRETRTGRLLVDKNLSQTPGVQSRHEVRSLMHATRPQNTSKSAFCFYASRYRTVRLTALISDKRCTSTRRKALHPSTIVVHDICVLTCMIVVETASGDGQGAVFSIKVDRSPKSSRISIKIALDHFCAQVFPASYVYSTCKVVSSVSSIQRFLGVNVVVFDIRQSVSVTVSEYINQQCSPSKIRHVLPLQIVVCTAQVR